MLNIDSNVVNSALAGSAVQLEKSAEQSLTRFSLLGPPQI